MRTGLEVSAPVVLRLLLDLQMETMSRVRLDQSLNDYSTLAQLFALSPHSERVLGGMEPVELTPCVSPFLSP